MNLLLYVACSSIQNFITKAYVLKYRLRREACLSLSAKVVHTAKKTDKICYLNCNYFNRKS